MYIVKNNKALAGSAIEPTAFEMLSRSDRNALQVETYRKNVALVTGVLNVDSGSCNNDIVGRFLKDSMIDDLDENEIEDELMSTVYRFDVMGVPNSLQDDFLSDDVDIVANSLDEIREFIADSYLDDHTPLEVSDSLYLADWLTVKGKRTGSRVGDDGRKLPAHVGKADINGKETVVTTFRPNKLGENYVKSKGKDGGKTRGKSSATRHHRGKGARGDEITKATKTFDKNKNKKDSDNDTFSDDYLNDSFLGFLADSIIDNEYLADSANPADKRQCNCGKTDSKHTCKKHIDPKTNKKSCIKVVKDGIIIDKKRSQKMKGKNIPASVLRKMAKTKEIRQAKDMYDENGVLK